MSPTDFVVTVNVRLARAKASPDDFEAVIADALMEVDDVATVRIELAPAVSVCRLDATGEARDQVEAACRATVERTVARFGTDCEIDSVIALTTAEWKRQARNPASA